MKYVIYDFNGTILDDVQVCIDSLNYIVDKYLDRDEVSLEEYLEVFDFPVIDYYKRIGFDFVNDSFEKVGKEWVDTYLSKSNEYHLMEGVLDFIKENKAKGYKNIILSATKKEMLMGQLKDLGILEYFDEVLGIDNIYATSKVNVALEFIKDKNKEECILIGDTMHDLDVANEMGIKCVLVAKGHQSKQRLLAKHSEVYDDIREIKL